MLFPERDGFISKQMNCLLVSADIKHQIVLDCRKMEAPYEQKLKRAVINKNTEIRLCLIPDTKDLLLLWVNKSFWQAGPLIHLHNLV